MIEIIPPLPSLNIKAADLLSYQFHNDDSSLQVPIQLFHQIKGEGRRSEEEIFTAAGLSPLITALMLLVRRQGIRRLYYIRPLYYTFYFLADALGIQLVSVNSGLLINSAEELQLPTVSGQWLIVSDPIWFVGRYISPSFVEQIRLWQDTTGGHVIVDGAFQYQRWRNNDLPEQTSGLNPSLTVRCICPTKASAVHGVRFAYALIPVGLREDLRYSYSNTSGSASAYDKYAAQALMEWLNLPISNSRLLDYISKRHTHYTGRSYIEDPIDAQASYFCFVRVPVDRSHLIVMDEVFFDTAGYPDFLRFNLLLPEADLEAYVSLAELALHGKA